MAQELEQYLIDLGVVGLGPDGRAEFGLDHVEDRFDIRSLTVVRQELRPVKVVEVVSTLPQGVALVMALCRCGVTLKGMYAVPPGAWTARRFLLASNALSEETSLIVKLRAVVSTNGAKHGESAESVDVTAVAVTMLVLTPHMAWP